MKKKAENNSQSVIVKNYNFMTAADRQELADYIDLKATMRERAYQEVVSALKRIVDFFQMWPLIKSDSKDPQIARSKTDAILEYLTGLAGEFSKAATVYHGVLIQVSDNVHGVVRMPDTDYINDFLEAQALAQDTISHALKNPDQLESLYQALKESPLLDKDFADLIASKKRRHRDRAIETIQTGEAVQFLIDGRGKQSGMSRISAILQVAEETNNNFNAVARAYTRWQKTQTKRTVK